MKKIPLTQNKFALVDDEDYDYLMQWKWYAVKNFRTFYAYRYGGAPNKRVLMHREIMKTPEELVCDHKYHNGLDNQKAGLRNCTRAQDMFNRRHSKNCTSGLRGVSPAGRGCWRTNIVCKGTKYFKGYFQTKEEAARAYDEAAKELHGEFAILNYPI